MLGRGFVVLMLCAMGVASAGEAGATWPCFHGARRDNISAAKGLLGDWPEQGPPLLWTAPGIGHGYSSVAIAADRIFTAGTIDKQTYVTALDMTGKIQWQKVNGRSWEATARQPWAVPYSGARGTPTVDGDTVYHLSELGRLTAFDLATGRERWHVDVFDAFAAERPKYGLSESVLIRGDSVFCCPGGADGYVVALDKRSGRTQWANTTIQDPVGYCSPVVARIDGIEQIITMSAKRIFAFAPESGRFLWEYPFGNARGTTPPTSSSVTDWSARPADTAGGPFCCDRGGRRAAGSSWRRSGRATCWTTTTGACFCWTDICTAPAMKRGAGSVWISGPATGVGRRTARDR